LSTLLYKSELLKLFTLRRGGSLADYGEIDNYTHEVAIESIFGIDVDVAGNLTVDGCVADLDPSASLRGLCVGNQLFDVHADGTFETS
jgi:hypothetical protein